MPSDSREAELHALVDEIAHVLEHSGFSPVVGRIVARLMTCVPPGQSSAQLAEYCHASKGAISTGTRMLMQMELVERVRIRGDRAAYFRMVPNAWATLVHGENARLHVMLALADRTLALMSEHSADERARMQEFRDMYQFLADEFPALLERWESKRKQK